MPKNLPKYPWDIHLRRTFSPYDESPDAKRRRIDFSEGVLTAAGLPEIAGGLQEVKNLIDSTGDQVVPRLSAAPRSSRRVRSSRRSSRMGKRSWKRRGRRRRKSFAAKVGSTLLRFKETHRTLDAVAQANFSAGDGTSRVLYIAAPVSNLSQGTEGRDYSGDDIWIKAIKLRGRISLDQTTNSLRVRILLLHTNQFADLPAGFTVYGSATTSVANPTQVSEDLEQNIKIFETPDAEEAGQPSAAYVGNASGIDIIDLDLVKVLGGREFFLSQQHLLNFQNIDLYWPINRRWRAYSEVGAVPPDQIRSHQDGNYYIVLQVFSNSNANNILAAQDILGTFDILTYFKNLQ